MAADRCGFARAVLAGLCAFSLVTGPVSAGIALASPQIAHAAPADQISSELDAAREKLSDLTDELELAEAAADETQIELGDTQDAIEDLEGRIAANEDDLKTARAELSRYMALSYKGGSVSLFELLFSSTSFDQLISRVFYASRIASAEADGISRVQQLEDELSAEREELSQHEQDLSELLDRQEETASDLKQSRADATSYIDGLSSELKKALAAERAEAARESLDAAGDDADAADDAADAPAADDGRDDSSNDAADTDGKDETPAPAPSKPSSGGGSSGGGSHAGSGSMTSAQRNTVVSVALSQVGCAYDYGAQRPGVAFDCSGLTQYVFSRAGISIPRTATPQYNQVKKAGNLTTSESALVAGDLVFYQTNGRIRHVAVYIGGGKVCHASNYNTGVIVTNLHYSKGFCGGGSPV